MRSSIRPYRPDDLDALRLLVAEMQDHERGIDARLRPGSEMMRAYTEDMLRRCLETSGQVLIAETEDRIVGFVAVQAAVPNEALDQRPGTYALVSDLAVDSRYRGLGIGRSLVAAAEEYACRQGATELRIAVLAGNEVADRLYRAAGFLPYLNVLSKDVG
jgi:ribosomal protein S18 acetylase RimI-like enzyme